jgi:hypothetical protein
MRVELEMGVDSPTKTPRAERQAITTLKDTVKYYLPSFVESIAMVVAGKANVVTLHQDAFAAGYDIDEYTLLGMAIKYAGLYGVALFIAGNNHETFEQFIGRG